ncbi:CAR1 transcription factor isoform X2 [Ceratitis capitata]|uniref:CAR1 transcription factor isoform X2 n=1 Tax=Ceratitis capitata TaxID=7213 RepID=UPI000329A4A0|nr:CAR1 transcription factor isoform X2 [Ceratitis capitata]
MEDNNTSTPMKSDESVTLTIRLIMQGKEVGSIIGKKGEIVNRFREESGAKINISDGSCPERIVTVSGTTSSIFSAFTLITKKFEEWCSQFSDVGKVGKTQIPIRLIVPASQCGSLIGKSGSKIKEIRQTTGCSIQVASEMLPNSTERAVTLSGTAEQITQCIYQICLVMLESPPRGATIPYRPKPQVSGPVILANGQAYTIQGNYAVPAQETCPVFPLALATGGLHAGISGLTDPLLKGAHLQGAVPAAHHHLQHIPDVAKNPLASLAALGLAGITPTNTGGLNPTALAALAGSQLRTANTSRTQQQQHEMTVSNDLIGCIIGKGGTKIAEIRQISGAMIRISNCEEREGGNTDRTITISGNPDSVALAQYLINMSVELQKANLQEANNCANGQVNNGGSGNNNNGNNNSNNNNANGNANNSNNNSNNGNHLSGNSSSGGGGSSNGSLNQCSSSSSSGSSNHSNSNNSLNNLNTNSTNNSNSNTHSSTAMSITSNSNSNNSGNSNNNTSSNNISLNSTSNNPTNPFTTTIPFTNPPNPFANSTTVSSLATAIPLAQLLSKPGALNALSSLTALGGLTDLLGGLATLNGPPIQTTGVHRTKSFASTRFRSHNHAGDGNADSEKTRNKFNPY